MPGRTLVTIGSDGIRDFVTLPDGRAFNLGSVSILRLVTECADSGHTARKVLDQFLKQGEAPMSLRLEDLEKLVFKPRARWAFDNTLVSGLDRTCFSKGASMGSNIEVIAFDEGLDLLERHMDVLEKHAGTTKTASSKQLASEVIESFHHLAVNLRPKTAAEANEVLVEDILKSVEATLEGIAHAESEGLPVNGALARTDLHKIASSLSSLLEVKDLESPTTRDGLRALAKRANTIHNYFV